MESENNDMEVATNVREPQNVGLLEIAGEFKKTNESRHTVVCCAAQEVVASHHEYIDRKTKKIFTPM